MTCPRCEAIAERMHPYHSRWVQERRLIERGRWIRDHYPKGDGSRERELTALAHAYGVGLRTLQRYLKESA